MVVIGDAAAGYCHSKQNPILKTAAGDLVVTNQAKTDLMAAYFAARLPVGKAETPFFIVHDDIKLESCV